MSLPTDLLTLAQAAKSLPTRPNVATIWRWCSRGLRGVVLRTVKVGGRTFVSAGDLDEFLRTLNGQSKSMPSPSRATAKKEAEEYLLEQGL